MEISRWDGCTYFCDSDDLGFQIENLRGVVILNLSAVFLSTIRKYEDYYTV